MFRLMPRLLQFFKRIFFRRKKHETKKWTSPYKSGASPKYREHTRPKQDKKQDKQIRQIKKKSARKNRGKCKRSPGRDKRRTA